MFFELDTLEKVGELTSLIQSMKANVEAVSEQDRSDH